MTRQAGVFPAGNPVQAFFTYELQGPDVGGYRVCFTNNSTGPVVTSEWDFDGDGTYDLTSSDQVVCHIYASEGVFTVRLRVSNFDMTSQSTASQAVNVVAAPTAAFTVTPGTNIVWGTNVNFTDTSSGVITSWAWDFNGDGTTDSTQQNPTNVSLTALGANPIRLTVTGPGGSSYVEQIIFVARLEITCDFTGNLNILPGSGAQTYTSQIGNIGGRAITYNWTVSGSGAGLPLTFSTSSINVNWGSIGFGSFQIRLDASTADGSNCSKTHTVTHSWAPLDCQMSDTLPGTLYGDGQTYTFTANVLNLSGRTISGYEWYLNGALQGATGNSFTWTNTTDTSLLPMAVTISYRVIVDNGAGYSPSTSDCTEAKSFTVQQWPTLVCNSITGQFTPEPITPDNLTRSYTYTVNTTGITGRTVLFTWSVTGGTITSTNPSSSNQVTVQWDPTMGSFPPAPADESLSVVVLVTNPDGTTETCNPSHTVAVTVFHLVCNLPSGDINPVVGETVNYTRNLVNTYGRTITVFNWDVEQLTPVVNSYSDPSHPLSLTFPTPNATYRIRYNTTVAAEGGLPGDSCTSAWLNLTVYDVGVGFECEGNLLGNANPTNPASTYVYTIDMDNGNGYTLQYRYILTDYLGVDHILSTPTSTADGTISSPAFTLNQLGPLGVDNYSLRVEVTEVGQVNTTYSCQKSLALVVGTLSANYSYNASGWTNSAVPINQAICFTNTSTATPGTIDTLNYVWSISGNAADNSLGVNTFNGKDLPACLSFSQTGSYTVRVTGTTNSGLRTATHVLTFNIYGLQSILINRTGSSFAPSTQSFTATGTNITGAYSWEFRRVSDNFLLGTRTGASVTFPFSVAGTYRAIVSGTGNLGTTTASLEFTLLAPDGLTAGFSASQYGGIAPLDVCFTDTSISGSQIVLWEWDLDGDGTFELTYNNSNIPASVCHTYTVPATVTQVRLRVTNAGFTDTATNPIRTYSLLEGSVSFSIAPNGVGSYCFTAQIPPGVVVTGWDFGDTTSGPGQNQICHLYSVSGVYLVSMNVQQGPETGTVVRVVNVNLNSGPAPSMTVAASCSADRTASFTVTNSGGAMTTPDQVFIRDMNGTIIRTDTLMLGAGASATFTISNVSGNVTFETVDFQLSASTTCFYPPEISVAPTCGANSLPVFVVSNNRPNDGPMAAAQDYEIRDSQGTLIVSSSFILGQGVSSIDIPVPPGNNPYETYTFSSNGAVGSFTVNENCATQPDLSVTSQCANPIAFTVTNNGGDMVIGQAYTIVDGSSATVDSGTLNLAAGASVTITLTGLDPYAGYTFTSNGFASDVTMTQNCARPDLTVTSQCASPIAFTVTNNGGDMLSGQAYTIVDGSSATVDSGTLNLAAGASVTITLTGLDPYAGYTFTSNGFASDVTMTQNCARPDLTVTSQCASPIAFTVTNNGGDMLAGQAYTLVDGSSATVDSGTLNLAAGASTTITLTGLDPYAGYTFTSNGFASDVTMTQNCQRPQLDASTLCAETVSFTVTNNGGVMLLAQPYTVTDAVGTVLVADVLNLGVGESVTIPLPGVNPYKTYTLQTDGFAGTINMVHSCEQPLLRVTTTCTNPIGFIVTNDGGDMLTQHSYHLVWNVNVDVTPASPDNQFLLLKGELLKIDAPPVDMALGLKFWTDDLTITAEATMYCVEFGPAATETPLLFSGLSAHELSDQVDWNSVPVCGYGCPTFRLYHTDETNNWNIFRLDGADQATRQSFRQNLTFGEGQGVEDIAPSLSPNQKWVVFSSNRDGNWEIYVASTSGDPSSVQRVTYNTVANDTDPVWGPNNFVAFETTRNGNWDLYVVDMSTGQEFALTTDSSNDINPFWSPDGSRLLFQSDRPDENGVRKWQIYQLTLGSGEVTRLSDGSSIDVDPQFSNGGSQIVYRTYAAEGANSQLALMNANGTNKRTITSIEEDATDPAWSPQDHYIAYQSNLDGDLDIYIYDVAAGQTRKLTDNTIKDYAPTWTCTEIRVVFTSDSAGNPDIYEADVQPITAGPIAVDKNADQLTFETSNDIYPEGFPVEENASREGQTVIGMFGEQTVFLRPDTSTTQVDLSLDGDQRDDWRSIDACEGSDL